MQFTPELMALELFSSLIRKHPTSLHLIETVLILFIKHMSYDIHCIAIYIMCIKAATDDYLKCTAQ